MVLRKLLSGGLKGEKRECKSPSKASPSTSIEYSVDDAFCQGDGTRPTHFIFGDDASPSSKRLSSRGGSMTELGRFLRQAEAEKGSDDDQQTFDQTTQTTLDGVEIYEYNAPRDGYSTLPVEMSMFSLSLLKYDIGPEYDSLAERIVKNGLRRHVEHHFNAPMDRVKSRTMPFSGININECLKKDPEKVESLARELITCAEYDEAIVLYKLLLRRQSKKRKGESADTLSKLSILCLLVGDTKTALSYGQRALRLRREESRQAQIAICLHQLGLVYFCGKKPEKALDAWREALQIICLVFGYDHPYVATLLNNLGCLHYHEGNFPVSLKTFFESLDLNRKFLGASVGGTNSIILDMAITKTNIANNKCTKGEYGHRCLSLGRSPRTSRIGS